MKSASETIASVAPVRVFGEAGDMGGRSSSRVLSDY
jgi:hypothetical protein